MEPPKESFPLRWPEGWPRAKSRSRSKFKTTLFNAADEIFREINRLGAPNGIISSNIPLRLDGRPRGGQAVPIDTGVAVYFSLGGKRCVIACDKWLKPEENLWAIVKHIESLRGQDRWGCGSMERAFAGYTAIPEKTGGISWWEVLGVQQDASEEVITAAYRALAKKHHPDVAKLDPNQRSERINDAMVRLNDAYRLACSQRMAKGHA